MKFEMINDTKKLCIRPAHLAMSDLENTEFLELASLAQFQDCYVDALEFEEETI